jgi:hypothetical protein
MQIKHLVTALSTAPFRFIATLACLLGVSMISGPRAHAEDLLPLGPRASSVEVDGPEESDERVNRPLMIVGATLFVGSYAPSLAFATLGDWNADDALAIPVAGPWMALANPENAPLSKALLVNSGVMQGVGVLSMALSLVIPNYGKSTTLRFGKNEMRLSPSQMARGAFGLGASGSF